MKVYTEVDSARGVYLRVHNITTGGTRFASEITHVLAHGTEEGADLPSASSLSASCSEPSAETEVPAGATPRLSDGFPYFRNSIRLPSRSGAFQFRPVQVLRRSHFCSTVMASLDSFPSHSSEPKPGGRRCSGHNVAPTRLVHAAAGRRQRSTAPREACVRHRMNRRCRKHEYAAPGQRKKSI